MNLCAAVLGWWQRAGRTWDLDGAQSSCVLSWGLAQSLHVSLQDSPVGVGRLNLEPNFLCKENVSPFSNRKSFQSLEASCEQILKCNDSNH